MASCVGPNTPGLDKPIFQESPALVERHQRISIKITRRRDMARKEREKERKSIIILQMPCINSEKCVNKKTYHLTFCVKSLLGFSST